MKINPNFNRNICFLNVGVFRIRYLYSHTTKQMNIHELTHEQRRKLAREYFGKADCAKEDGEYDECIEYCGKCIELDPDAEIAYQYRSRYIYKRAHENNCAEDFEIALSDNLNLVRIYSAQQNQEPEFYDNYQGLERKESAATDAAWCYLQLGRYQAAYDAAVGVLERLKPTNGWKTRLQNVIKFSKEGAGEHGKTLRLNEEIEADLAKSLNEPR